MFELSSSNLDSGFSGFSRDVEISSGADGLTGLAIIGGVSMRGFVTSEPDRGLRLGPELLGEAVGRGGRGRILDCMGVVIGPVITLDGTILGAGAGM